MCDKAEFCKIPLEQTEVPKHNGSCNKNANHHFQTNSVFHFTFHKYLLSNGYYMLQFSVYVKLCHTFDYAQEVAQKLEKNSPKVGNVRYFLITEKQFCDMKILVGKETRQEKIKNINYLEIL